MKIWPLKINISTFWKFHFLIWAVFWIICDLFLISRPVLTKKFFLCFYQFFYIMIVKCLISYVTIQIFRPNGLLLWFLYNFKKKFPKKIFFQNFQRIELWGPVKGSRPLLPPKLNTFCPIYNPRAIQKSIL